MDASGDAANLDRLHDIVVPAAPGIWPPAPGWIAVAITLLVVAAIGALVLARRRRVRAYRRAGRAELRELSVRIGDDRARDAALAELPVLLKRVALATYPRSEVAALTGDAWLAFLDRSAGMRAFATGPGRRIAVLAHDGALRASLSRAEGDELVGVVGEWIDRHSGRPAR